MIKFGTGGWREIIGDGFTKENLRILSQAIATNMGPDEKSIVIGYDRRFLSDRAAKWAAEVFAGNGVEVVFINRISPTPLVMFAVKDLGMKYGMSITASHNPAEYNGVKIFTQGGKDADLEYTDMLEETIAKGDKVLSMDFTKGIDQGLIKINKDIYNAYIDSIISMIDMESIKSKNMKILLDPMFGVSKTSLQTILMTARCDVDIINDRHDTLFGGRLPSPSASTLKRLSELVVEREYDLGIGTDGDADRIGIIDDKGHFIHPNEILVLLYYYLLKYKKWEGDVVRNIATSHLLDKIAEDFGFICHEVPVGFKNISSKMEETDALIGGESSGGMTIRGHIKGKDGIFASALLVEMISVTGQRLSEMLEEVYQKYGKTYTEEFDTKFTKEKREELEEVLFADKKLPDFKGILNLEIDRVSYLDGVKVYFKNAGWVICRFSGTEPLIRVFSEMPTKEEAEQVIDLVKEMIG